MTTTSPIQAGRQYRRRIYGILIVGLVSLFIGMLINQSLAGLIIYAIAVIVGFALMFYVQYHDALVLQDEREAELERRASHLTFQLFGYLGLFAFIALFLLDATGYRSMQQTEITLLYVFSVLSLSWGGIYALIRYRQ